MTLEERLVTKSPKDRDTRYSSMTSSQDIDITVTHIDRPILFYTKSL